MQMPPLLRERVLWLYLFAYLVCSRLPLFSGIDRVEYTNEYYRVSIFPSFGYITISIAAIWAIFGLPRTDRHHLLIVFFYSFLTTAVAVALGVGIVKGAWAGCDGGSCAPFLIVVLIGAILLGLCGLPLYAFRHRKKISLASYTRIHFLLTLPASVFAYSFFNNMLAILGWGMAIGLGIVYLISFLILKRR